MKYPLFYPNIHKKDILKEIDDTLSTRWIGEGPKVKIFEQKFGEFLGARYPVAVNSCTSALHLAYLLAGAKKDTEVIAPVFTCSATIHAIMHTGATPVFADIKNDFTIDPKDVAKKITKKTVAVVAVDYSGKRCDYKELKKFLGTSHHRTGSVIRRLYNKRVISITVCKTSARCSSFSKTNS